MRSRLSFLFLALPLLAQAQLQPVIEEHFQNRDGFTDLSLLHLWGNNQSPTSAFRLLQKTDQNGFLRHHRQRLFHQALELVLLAGRHTYHLGPRYYFRAHRPAPRYYQTRNGPLLGRARRNRRPRPRSCYPPARLPRARPPIRLDRLPSVGVQYDTSLLDSNGSVILTNIVGLEEAQPHPPEVRVFPNPGRQGQPVQLEWPKKRGVSRIAVFDAAGRPLKQQRTQGHSLQLATGDWAAGTYRIRFETEESTIGSKTLILR